MSIPDQFKKYICHEEPVLCPNTLTTNKHVYLLRQDPLSELSALRLVWIETDGWPWFQFIYQGCLIFFQKDTYAPNVSKRAFTWNLGNPGEGVFLVNNFQSVAKVPRFSERWPGLKEQRSKFSDCRMWHVFLYGCGSKSKS